jgi:hypothetical protein
MERSGRLHELSAVQASLEEAYMDATRDAVEYHAVTAIDATVDPELAA